MVILELFTLFDGKIEKEEADEKNTLYGISLPFT